MKEHILIITFALDLRDTALAQQHTVVKELASRFNRVTVITGKIGEIELPSNVFVKEIKLQNTSKIIYIFKFLKTIVENLILHRIDVVFCHMTDVQSALMAPVTKLLRTPHYLWYAHTHSSIYIKFAYPFIDGVITSTKGSCPLKGKKVHIIGQGIDQNIFRFNNHRDLTKFDNLVHIGRFDKSKRIDKIIGLLVSILKTNPKTTLALYGDTLDKNSNDWAEEIILSNQKLIPEKLNFYPGTSRKNVPKLLSQYDVFVHAYQGSLDKVLIEATMLGIPVITENSEYLKTFQTWSGAFPTTLQSEFEGLINHSPGDLAQKLIDKSTLAVNEHSLNQWITRLATILSNK